MLRLGATSIYIQGFNDWSIFPRHQVYGVCEKSERKLLDKICIPARRLYDNISSDSQSHKITRSLYHIIDALTGFDKGQTKDN